MSRACSVAVIVLWCMACGGNPLPSEQAEEKRAEGTSSGSAAKDEPGETVTPPFTVAGELDGLLLVWFDEQGLHTASKRSDIPEARRKQVRIDSLSVAPDKRLDAEHVYVADVSATGPNGRYPVRKYTRTWFEAQADGLTAPPAQAADASGVTLYMASWCGACRAAGSYLRSRDIPFVEKDIEKDSAANAEMLQKARAAGKTPRGVPVIDFRGNILLGFDQGAIDRLIAQAKPI